MSDMKCPLCLQKMNKTENNMFYCGTNNCSLRYIEMPKKAVEEFAESYQARLTDCKRIGNLNEELIRTRKALDVAVDALKEISLHYQNELDKPVAPTKWFSSATDMCDYADNALEQITALEQKDKQCQ